MIDIIEKNGRVLKQNDDLPTRLIDSVLPLSTLMLSGPSYGV